MSLKHQCEGVVKSGERCKKYTKAGTLHCFRHHPPIIKELEGANIENPIPSDDIKLSLGDCAICLEEVHENDDCGLVCKHPHHQACILQLKVNPVCPVCRGTIEGSLLNKKDKSKMENRLKKEKEDARIAQVQADHALAMRMEQGQGFRRGGWAENIYAMMQLHEIIARLRGGAH